MKKQYVVTVDIPCQISVREMEWYIRDAVRAWKGGGDPDSVLFNMDSDAFTVKPIKDKA